MERKKAFRYFVLFFMLFIFMVALLEISSYLTLRFIHKVDRHYILQTLNQRIVQDQKLQTGLLKQDAPWLGGYVIHPYLGYVKNIDLEQPGRNFKEPVNKFGFMVPNIKSGVIT